MKYLPSSLLHRLPLTRTKIFIAKILYRITVIFFGRKPRVIARNGIRYEVDLSEGLDLSLFLFGGFQKHITRNKYLRLPEDAVIFDVGANFGLMSLPFGKAAPKGLVYSFEPTHYALAKLRRNLDLNPELASHIRVVNSFISASSSTHPEIKAFSSWKVDGAKSDDMHPVHLGATKSAEGVGAVSLDDFCRENKLEKLDFIKIDTDGHEFEVLNGARETIAKYRPQIIFEIGLYVMQEKNIDFSFYTNYFGSLDYHLLDVKTGNQLTFENHRKYIPPLGTIDAIALSNVQVHMVWDHGKSP